MHCLSLPPSFPISFTSSSLSTHTIEVRLLFSLRGIFSLKTPMQSKLHRHIIFYYLHLIILTQNFSFPYRINAKHFFWVIHSSFWVIQNNSISWPSKSRNVTLCGKGAFANIVKLKILRWDRSELRWALKSMTSPYRRREEDMDTDTQGRRRWDDIGRDGSYAAII